jgi:hypothetical protein
VPTLPLPAIRANNISKVVKRDRAPKLIEKVGKQQGLFVRKADLMSI